MSAIPPLGGWGIWVSMGHLLSLLSLCLCCRLYTHIQLASKLTSGCDYSLFKV